MVRNRANQMINKRITYTKITDDIQATRYNFVCNKMVCRGYYDSKRKAWYIINLITEKTIMFGHNNSETLAKQTIKKSLISLGANFLDEVRSTKTNQTPMLTAEVIDEIVRKKEGN